MLNENRDGFDSSELRNAHRAAPNNIETLLKNAFIPREDNYHQVLVKVLGF